MSARLFRAEAKRAQTLADAEQDPQLKKAHAQRAHEMNEWAEIADLQRQLEKALREQKKSSRVSAKVQS